MAPIPPQKKSGSPLRPTKAREETTGPELRPRRSASAEGLSAIQAALHLEESPSIRPPQSPRPKPAAPPAPAPARNEAPPAPRPLGRVPDEPIRRSDYRVAEHKPDRHMLGMVVAILSMVAVLVALALAYWSLRR